MSNNTTSSNSGSDGSDGLPPHQHFPPVYPSVVAYAVYFTFFLAVFLSRRHFEPIKSRGWPLVVCSAIASFIYMVFDVIDFDFGHFSFGYVVVPCYQDALISGLFVPMWFFPLFYRCYLLWVKFRLNDDGLKAADKERLNNWIFRNKWTLKTTSFFVIYFFVFLFVLLITLAILFGQTRVGDNNYNLGFSDSCDGNVIVFGGTMGGLCVVWMAVFIYLLWHVRDAFAFKSELILLMFILLPLFIIWVISALGQVFPYSVPSLIWEELMVFVMFNITVVYPTVLTFYSKYNSQIMRKNGSSSELSSSEGDHSGSSIQQEFYEPGSLKFFVHLLDDPVLSEEFKKFCVELWCVENCLFYYAATEFAERHYSSAKSRRDAANIIYQRFVKADAPQEINIEYEVRESISEMMDGSETDEIPVTIFADAVKKVFIVMKTDTYKKFLKSSAFLGSYLSSPTGLMGGENAVQWLNAQKEQGGLGLRPSATNMLMSYRAGKKRSNKKGTTSATSPLSGEGNDSAEPLPKSLAQLGRHSSISVTDVFSHGSPSDIPLTEVPTRSDLP